MNFLNELPLIIGIFLIVVGVLFFVIKTQINDSVTNIEDAMIVFLTTVAFTLFGAIFISLYYIKQNIV